MTDFLPYRLCAIDLDETFLTRDHTISPRNLRAVRAIVQRGVTVVLASGRMHESILNFATQCGLDTPIISYNGAMVKNPVTSETWLHDPVMPPDAVRVLDYCEENDLHLQYYIGGEVLMKSRNQFADLYIGRTDSPYEVIPDFYQTVAPLATTKMVIVNTPDGTDTLKPIFVAMLGNSLYITKTSEEFLEFMSPGVSKGKALAKVAQRLGFRAEETIAFGNGQNDIPMIEFAALGVAVSDARPELLAVADRIAPGYEEDGVAQVLEEIYGL